MRIKINHRTAYRYPQPAWDSHNEVRLMPVSEEDQRCISFRLSVEPEAPISNYSTPWGAVHHFTIREPHRYLAISAESLVETRPRDPFDGLNLIEDDWAFYDDERISQRYAEYLAPTHYVSLHDTAQRLAKRARLKSGPAVASFLVDLTGALFREIEYDPRATHVHTTLNETVETRRGVCQDFAHWMLAACRGLGIPARYVSGYVYSSPDGPATQGEQATHAWVECLLPGAGWRGFDPTNNLLVGDRYVKIHVGRDYADVSPTRGVYRGPAADSMEVTVSVTEAIASPSGHSVQIH